MTDSEKKFLERIRTFKAKSYHNGWPDFFIVKNGKKYLIEVKDVADKLSSCQIDMFTALTEAGMSVLIYWLAHPDILIPWNRFHKRTTGESKRKATAAITGFKISYILGD